MKILLSYTNKYPNEEIEINTLEDLLALSKDKNEELVILKGLSEKGLPMIEVYNSYRE